MLLSVVVQDGLLSHATAEYTTLLENGRGSLIAYPRANAESGEEAANIRAVAAAAE